jgi:hypothetical protein
MSVGHDVLQCESESCQGGQEGGEKGEVGEACGGGGPGDAEEVVGECESGIGGVCGGTV